VRGIGAARDFSHLAKFAAEKEIGAGAVINDGDIAGAEIVFVI
jgi:hypothetical protein